MGERTIHLGARQQRRALILNQLLEGGLTIGQAAGLLGVSERQVQRLRAAYAQVGPAALVLGNTGRVP